MVAPKMFIPACACVQEAYEVLGGRPYTMCTQRTHAIDHKGMSTHAQMHKCMNAQKDANAIRIFCVGGVCI